MISCNIAESLFGPEYANSVSESVGTFLCRSGAGPIDIIYEVGQNIKLNILPVGGYVIRYLEGSFLLMGRVPTAFVIGGDSGLRVGWTADETLGWTETGFVLGEETKEKVRHAASVDVNGLFYLELLTPHRIQLKPPHGAAGDVKVKVTRYVPKFLSSHTIDRLVDTC